ncbi:uncharacterized protein LOC143427834 [Xylocopa sonorina]|uniref:uncharacterized protein LOC143427834 n=1 Tax=Xylocopa sonorina TaxID=1818115 RepID=UPI00403AED03
MDRASLSRESVARDDRRTTSVEARLGKLEAMLEKFLQRSRSRSKSRSRSPRRHVSRIRSRSSRSPRRRDSRSRSRRSDEHRMESITTNVTAIRATLPGRIRHGDENLIPVYDPAKEDMAIETWLRHVDELAKQYGWDDSSIMRLIATRLKGHARQWYDTRMRIATTWAEIKVYLVAQFRRTILFSRMLREADLYEAKPGQSLGDYCFQKLNLIRRLDIQLSDEKIVDMIIFGIPDGTLARTVRSAKYADSNELYASMCAMWKMPGRKEGKKIKTDRAAKTADKDEPKLSRCYNCGKVGHIVKDCRKPKIQCAECHKFGHRREDCSRNEVNVTQYIHNSNIFQMYIRVNGHKVESLVDTGSACMLIHASIIQKLVIKTELVDDTVLKGFTGQSVIINRIAPITVKIQNVVANVNSFVIPDQCMMHNAILGRDFLQQEHVLMLKRGNRLTFSDLKNCKRPQIIAAMDICTVEVSPTLNLGNVGNEERRLCVALIEEFRDCISSPMRDLGKMNTVSLEIRCVTDELIAYNPYRLAEPEKKVVRQIIADLLQNGIIRESDSPYASPITLVRKKTGDIRMCVDYRRLNAVTIKDKYPLPLIDDQIDSLGGNRYFTGLDLASGYYQVPVAENSIAKTAFVTNPWTFERDDSVSILGRRDYTVDDSGRRNRPATESIGGFPNTWSDSSPRKMFLFQTKDRVPRTGNKRTRGEARSTEDRRR